MLMRIVSIKKKRSKVERRKVRLYPIDSNQRIMIDISVPGDSAIVKMNKFDTVDVRITADFDVIK